MSDQEESRRKIIYPLQLAAQHNQRASSAVPDSEANYSIAQNEPFQVMSDQEESRRKIIYPLQLAAQHNQRASSAVPDSESDSYSAEDATEATPVTKREEPDLLDITAEDALMGATLVIADSDVDGNTSVQSGSGLLPMQGAPDPSTSSCEPSGASTMTEIAFRSIENWEITEEVAGTQLQRSLSVLPGEGTFEAAEPRMQPSDIELRSPSLTVICMFNCIVTDKLLAEY